MNQRKRRLVQLIERAQQIRKAPRVGYIFLTALPCRVAHPFEIGTRAEMLAVRREHDTSHRWIPATRRQFGLQLGNELCIESVVFLRPGQRDPCCAMRTSLRPEMSGCLHIRNTPKRVGATGAPSPAWMASPNTRRVSAGEMIPSSQRRAVE